MSASVPAFSSCLKSSMNQPRTRRLDFEFVQAERLCQRWPRIRMDSFWLSLLDGKRLGPNRVWGRSC